MLSRITRPLACALLAATALASCGGGGLDGYFEDQKQQVTVSIAPRGTILAKPGEVLKFTANAKVLDDKLSSMGWSLQSQTANVTTPTPTLDNGSCASVTMSKKSDDYVGECTTLVRIPDTAEKFSWMLSANAKAENKGQATDTVTIDVVAPAYPAGNLQIVVPQHLMSGAELHTYEIVSIPATMTANAPITNPTYKWTQITNNTSTGALMLAGASSSVLQFIPRAAGYYQFQVEGRGIVNGREETATDTVTVLITDSREQANLVVTTNGIQRVKAGDLVTLTGSATYNGGALNNPRYSWAQVRSGDEPAVQLTGANTSSAQFVAPEIPATKTLTFELTVTDVDPYNATQRVGKATAYVTVYGTGEGASGNNEVIVSVSAPSKVEGGDFTTITASATYNGQPLTNAQYEWTQKAGPAVTISNEHTPSPSFYYKATQDTQIVLYCTVTGVVDGKTVSGTSTVELIITPKQG